MRNERRKQEPPRIENQHQPCPIALAQVAAANRGCQLVGVSVAVAECGADTVQIA